MGGIALLIVNNAIIEQMLQKEIFYVCSPAYQASQEYISNSDYEKWDEVKNKLELLER